MRPVSRAARVPVSDGIVVNVIYMPAPVFLAAYEMLPKPALPQLFFSTGVDRQWNSCRDVMLDRAPAGGKVAVSFGHPPDAVQVVRQNHCRIHFKGPRPPGPSECFVQPANDGGLSQDGLSRMGHNCEEVTSTLLIGAPIVAHVGLILVDTLRLIHPWLLTGSCWSEFVDTLRLIHPTFLQVGWIKAEGRIHQLFLNLP
jgi:hypothetical protein